MAELGEQAACAARTKDAQRRSQELAEESAHLHDRLLETAELVRRSHEQTAEMMEHLAAAGTGEQATRRRRMAERSRRFAEEEARHIAELSKRPSREPNHGGAGDRPDSDPNPEPSAAPSSTV